ncbi:unnamed protein product [Adineta steineri]|uniref:C2 domain-containing protein n=1 Tax=Adineta steineri TaxID=433720 RepID=A0A815ZAB8_9BILA|nr:unnamed protein product [Adineta steineri]CAF1581442.1 unnamed protein product [Adineta steineri]
MALTVFLFKVANLNISKIFPETNVPNDNESTTSTRSVRFMVDENPTLVSARITFQGIGLWSNNVPVVANEASFLARGKKPKKFNFNLARSLTADDKLLVEFFTTTIKKRRKKLLGVFEIMLEQLVISKYIDLPEENLSDAQNYLLPSTVQLKLYYTPPDIEKYNASLGISDTGQLVDWKSIFDDEGRHGGHRYRHTQSKNDSKFKKLRTRIKGRADDADTDSYSDSDFNEADKLKSGVPIDEEKQNRIERGNIELLEKSLGRYEGDPYEINEWQIMIHIIQARELPGLDLNPYICIEIDEEKKYSNRHQSSNSPYFGEFFTFDFNLPASQVMQKVIFFKVHHAQKFISKFTDTKPVAVFRIDVSTVYNEKEHAFERKWAQLINPENIESHCGYLLVSIAVTERGAPSRNVLGEGVEDDDEYKPSKALIPAAMPHPLFPVEIKITFFTAAELPEMMTDFLASVSKKVLQPEGWEPVDPYVEVQYNTMRAVTSHHNGTTPVWSEAFHLIGRFPPLIRTIKISLKDHASVRRDRVISSFSMDLFSISETNLQAGFLPTLGPTWMFLYGSAREYAASKDQEALSEGMGEAICYKGRLLMEIECHPVSGENTSNMKIQKETGVILPEAHLFPMKRTFLLWGCIYDVTMIDKAFGNATICFELSIGSSGYLTPAQFVEAMHVPTSSLSQTYPRVPVDNNKQHFRIPIDLLKPILYTKYTFHDYMFRMTLTNRFKHASDHIYKQIRQFEAKINAKVTNEVLTAEYQKIKDYVHALPCGCGDESLNSENFGISPVVHPDLSEVLNASTANYKMNTLDEKRRKKLLINLESVKAWVSKKMDFDESKRYDIVKELNKIARSFRQMAFDAQPALPDVFLWMICDSKRVAYARIQPEDLLFNLCAGDKGLYNGRVHTFFLKTPKSSDQPLNPSTNAKVQMYLWLGIEEYEPYIYKYLPPGFEMPQLPLQTSTKTIRYTKRCFYEVRCHCLKARALLASDDTGLSDPFLSITVGSSTQTTPVLLQSLCPQWNMTLAFKNLIHIGTQESAEEIIGNVVVEIYDYDEDIDGPDLIGRFSTTAKLNSNNKNDPNKGYPFEWFELKIGDKRAGELLAAFELVEIDPDTRVAVSACELEQIPVTFERFPPKNYVTKAIKRHHLYEIPSSLMPPMKTYDIEIMFWGLRECRSIGFQAINQAEVTIECASERITRTIKDVQKYPNFSVSTGQPDFYTLRVDLPDDNNFWPHLSILCIQNRLFGQKEVVGNLVVTDLQKFIEKQHGHLSPGNEALADAINEITKMMPYDFNRVRKSIVDAYEAALASKNKDIGKEKLSKLENAGGHATPGSESQIAIIDADALQEENDDDTSSKDAKDKEGKDDKDANAANEPIIPDNSEHKPISTLEKIKRNDMEKVAGWWNKYYASKAKLRLAQRANANLYEDAMDTTIAYADFYDHRKKPNKKSFDVLNALKKVFSRAGKAQKTFRRFAAAQLDQSEDANKPKSAVDESLDNIETDRLKELTLLQTFDIVETELENVYAYEGFNDCLDTFSLFKGKGSNRSDETGDDKRIYAKFKGKLRIREVTSMTDQTAMSTFNIDRIPRMSALPAPLTTDASTFQHSKDALLTQTNQQMSQFNLNEHRITLKCRLYLIKALLYRGWDASGKADPFIKIALGDNTIIDDTKGKLHNTLEPVFGRSYEFDVTIPTDSLLRIQIWDWDMTSSNDIIAETKIDIENRFFSCHRATCGLPQRYDSAGYNAWRDTKKPTVILSELCQSTTDLTPDYSEDFQSVTIGDQTFCCDPACVEFIINVKSAQATLHRRVHHESPAEYIQQNTALVALQAWGKKINPKCALVAEHIECRSLFNDEFPETEQGKLEMWLDFFPMSRPPSSAPIDITPPVPTPYQLRLTIWNTNDVELNDENFVTGEKTSDIYVKAWILGENVDSQQTDVHYRSLTGEGNFNWRFVFDFTYLEIEEKIVYEAKDSLFQVGNTTKKIPPRIVIRVYDADLLSADDFLGECVLTLTHIPLGARTAKKCKANIVLDSKQPSTNLFVSKRLVGHWPMIAPQAEGVIRDKNLLGGKVEAEFSLLTAEEAEKNAVGKAREAPQPLDEPNRPKTSFLWFTSPWKVFRYVIWRNSKWPIIIALIAIICIVFLLLAIWTLPGAVATAIAQKVFKSGG